MSKVNREKCLQLDISLYNKAMKFQWKKDKIKKNLSGDLSTCTSCGRKYVICCICDEAKNKWDSMLVEIQSVAERDRSDDF